MINYNNKPQKKDPKVVYNLKNQFMHQYCDEEGEEDGKFNSLYFDEKIEFEKIFKQAPMISANTINTFYHPRIDGQKAKVSTRIKRRRNLSTPGFCNNMPGSYIYRVKAKEEMIRNKLEKKSNLFGN